MIPRLRDIIRRIEKLRGRWRERRVGANLITDGRHLYPATKFEYDPVLRSNANAQYELLIKPALHNRFS